MDDIYRNKPQWLLETSGISTDKFGEVTLRCVTEATTNLPNRVSCLTGPYFGSGKVIILLSMSMLIHR